MSINKILIIEDEQDIAELIEFNLKNNGYQVVISNTARAGLDIIDQDPQINLVLLDLMLPDMHGLDVCRKIRVKHDQLKLPIIMVTAKGEPADIVSGLELGADDYITKPFSPSVLIARVRALLRRIDNQKANKQGEHSNPNNSSSDILNLDGLNIDRLRYEVKIKDELLTLTSTEFHILNLLVSNVGIVYTRKQIIQTVHGKDYPVTDRSIDVQMTGLRKKLGVYGDNIETVRGIGYRYKDL